MDLLSSQVAALAGQNIFLAYLIVYLAAIFIGNIGVFVALWVAFQGGFGAWGVPFTLLAAACGNLTGDTLWYTMGRTLRMTRAGNWLRTRSGLYRRHGEKIEARVTERGRRWMLFGKFAYGTNFPIIFAIGWSRLPYRAFLRRSLLAVTLWLPVILGVSYGLYSGLAPLGAAIATVKEFEVAFLVGLAGFIVLQYFLAKIVAKFFNREDN